MIYNFSWCGPCKLLGPRLESIIASKKGKVVLAKVDVDQQDELAMAFKVSTGLNHLKKKKKKKKKKCVLHRS